jgi:hypothetical protein
MVFSYPCHPFLAFQLALRLLTVIGFSIVLLTGFHDSVCESMTFWSAVVAKQREFVVANVNLLCVDCLEVVPSGYVKIAIENGPVIVDLPIKDGDFPQLC